MERSAGGRLVMVKERRASASGPRRLLLGLLLGAAAILMAGMATAGDPITMPSLFDKPVPFDVPTSARFPDASILAGAPGSDGTFHAVVVESDTAFDADETAVYVRMNVSTGAAIDSRTLGPASGYGECDPACAAVWVGSGRVAVAIGYYGNGVTLYFFDEGQSSEWVQRRVPIPRSNVTGAPDDLAGLAFAAEATAGALPTLVWSRTNYPPQGVFTDFGTITADPLNRTASFASVLKTLINTSVEPMERMGWYGWQHRGWVRTQSFAAAVGADGLWVFYGAFTPPYTTAGKWYALSPLGAVTEIASIGQFSCLWIAATIAPDGSLAAAAFSSNAANAPQLTTTGWFSWAQVSGGAVSASWTGGGSNAGFSPAAGLALFSNASGITALTVSLAGSSGGPLHEVRLHTGWPSTATTTLFSSGQAPVVLRSAIWEGSDLVLVATRSPDPGAMNLSVTPTHLHNTSYGPDWPTIIRVSAGSEAASPFGLWEDGMASPLVSVSWSTLADGSEIGAAVFLVNGTPSLVFLGRPGAGTLAVVPGSPPFRGEITSARAARYGSALLIAVEVAFPRFEQFRGFGGGGWYWPSNAMIAYATWDNASGWGPAVYINATAQYELASIYWRLIEDGPNLLLFHRLGVFSLDPATGGATLVRAFAASSYAFDPALWNTSRVSATFLSSGFGYNTGWTDVHAVDFWMRGTDLYAALPVQIWSPCYCLRVQVSRIFANGSYTTFEGNLTAGPGNDTLVDLIIGDVVVVDKGPDSVRFAVLVQQATWWQRLFVVTFNETTGQFTSAPMVWSSEDLNLGYLLHRLQRTEDGFSMLRSSDWFVDQPYNSGPRLTLAELLFFNDTAVSRWPIVAVPSDFSAAYETLTYKQGAIPTGVWTWAIMGSAAAPALLVGEPNGPHLFGPNGPPTAISLLSPPNGSWVFGGTASLLVSSSFDPDGDPLSYRFMIMDGRGKVVLNLASPTNATSVTLADGVYRWWAFATDGVDLVASLEVFTFMVDTAAPVASAGGPYVIYPGETLELDASRSSDAWGVTSYGWTIAAAPGSGLTDLVINNTSALESISWSTLAPYFTLTDTLPISLAVTDPSGRISTAVSWVSLINPSIPIVVEVVRLTPFPQEGSAVRLAANVTWGNRTYSWTSGPPPPWLTVVWVFSDGAALVGLQVDFTPHQSGNFTAEVTAVHTGGGVGNTSLSLAVANVAPAASISGPLWLSEGEEAMFEADITDASDLDALSLVFAWSVEGNIAIVEQMGLQLRVRATTEGPAAVRVAVADMDGASGEARLVVQVNETALPATGLRVTGSGPAWLNVTWDPFTEEDAVGYSLRVFSPNGALFMERNSTWPDGALVGGSLTVEHLDPETTYRFELVVVAKGNVNSPPISTSGTTTALPPPPPEEPPNPEPPPVQPPATTPPLTVSTLNADLAWAVALILAAATALLMFLLARERQRRPPEEQA